MALQWTVFCTFHSPKSNDLAVSRALSLRILWTNKFKSRLTQIKGKNRDRRHVTIYLLCPLWVKSRHMRRNKSCPLYPRKRTCAVHQPVSALVVALLILFSIMAAANKTDAITRVIGERDNVTVIDGLHIATRRVQGFANL